MKKVTIITLSLICIALTYFVIKAKAAPQNAGHEYMFIYKTTLSNTYIESTDKGSYKEELIEKGLSGVLKKIKEFETKGWKLNQMTDGGFLLEK